MKWIAGSALAVMLALWQPAFGGEPNFSVAQTGPNQAVPRPAAPASPRTETKQEDPALKACLAETRSLKEKLAGLDKELKDTKAQLVAATKPACLAENVYRDASGKVGSCGAYKCFNAACNKGCNNTEWCTGGFVCETLPRPGRCVPPT